MTSYTTIILVEIVIFVLVVVTLSRMIRTIQPGQVGLVFRAGSFRVALRPGFNLVPHPQTAFGLSGSGGVELIEFAHPSLDRAA